MARITHPRPELGAQKFIGITFRDGIAEADDLNQNFRDSLIQHGFTIDDTPELEEKTVEQLRAELESFGYDVKKSWRKPELVERIAQHLELNEPGDGGFAIVEMPDGNLIGDGKSIATLPADEATAPGTEV